MKMEFDVDMLRDEYDAVTELCLRRLGQMQTVAQAGVDIPEVLIMAIQPPISEVELDLKEKSEWFARWLSTDQGIKSPMPLRAAVELLVKGQFQGAVQHEATIATGQGVVQAAAMAPAAMGQAALEQQGQQESVEPDPTAILQAQQDVQTQQMEAQENERQRQHEREMLDAEGKRDKDVAQHDATQKIRIEKAKPVRTAKPAK